MHFICHCLSYCILVVLKQFVFGHSEVLHKFFVHIARRIMGSSQIKDCVLIFEYHMGLCLYVSLSRDKIEYHILHY
jgi:hypothetical protein